ncbi:LRR receptor-like serine threonine-protein kinase [Seminavis robusta]|uniref:LRR receptor-like serine threonine-protein kinase n=1 Tax=Seminavis robusta TaxID=568900 RepID=A0A9N8DPK4_9STRA|nr:LRR receptor-like serine threonine-protein kinase [Seminavis robusta]|eukprot:Sro279_g106760.1 LRR receptor-like serine threonine-protein kinase (730) ;mRNA; r:26686-29327
MKQPSDHVENKARQREEHGASQDDEDHGSKYVEQEQWKELIAVEESKELNEWYQEPNEFSELAPGYQRRDNETTDPFHDGFSPFPDIMDDIQPLPDMVPPSLHSGGSGTREVEPGAYALGGGIRPAFYRPRTTSVSNTAAADLIAPGIELVPIDTDTDTAPNAALEEGLVRAQPVEEDVEWGDLPEAEPMTERAKKLWKKKICLSLTVEMMVGIIMILTTTLAVAFRSSDHDELQQATGIVNIPTTLTTTTTSLEATKHPATSTMDARIVALNLPDYTVEAMQDHGSPQHKAYEWILANWTNIETYPSWRLKQRFALATLFYSTRGQHWVNHHGWLDWETHECHWEQSLIYSKDDAVPCDNSGHMQSLRFFNTQLVGTIPPELSLLSSSLERLDLQGNLQLTGQLPTEIGLLRKLSTLCILQTDFSGSLPTELGLLERLEYLGLGSKSTTGNVPSELGQLGKLTDLSFLGMALITGTLPTEIYKLQFLWVFLVDDCPGMDSSSILAAIITSEMARLKTLVLKNNGYRAGALSMPFFPADIGRLSELRVLYLNGCQLHNAIPSEIGSGTRKLTSLYLNENHLSQQLPSELFMLTDLKYLSLFSNQLTGKISPKLFENLRKLERFIINNNQFSGSLATEIGLLSNLKELDLQSTALSGTLPSELLALPNLNGLSVANTSLSGRIPDGLCSALYRNEFECHDAHGCYPKKAKTDAWAKSMETTKLVETTDTH